MERPESFAATQEGDYFYGNDVFGVLYIKLHSKNGHNSSEENKCHGHGRKRGRALGRLGDAIISSNNLVLDGAGDITIASKVHIQRNSGELEAGVARAARANGRAAAAERNATIVSTGREASGCEGQAHSSIWTTEKKSRKFSHNRQSKDVSRPGATLAYLEWRRR